MASSSLRAAILRDRERGLCVRDIAVNRNITTQLVRAVLNAHKRLHTTQRVLSEDVRKGCRDTAQNLIRNGIAPSVVLANFCDVITPEDVEKWSAL